MPKTRSAMISKSASRMAFRNCSPVSAAEAGNNPSALEPSKQDSLLQRQFGETPGLADEESARLQLAVEAYQRCRKVLHQMKNIECTDGIERAAVDGTVRRRYQEVQSSGRGLGPGNADHFGREVRRDIVGHTRGKADCRPARICMTGGLRRCMRPSCITAGRALAPAPPLWPRMDADSECS